ncbi:hypothetical protein AB205_0064230 [Aquarana catesbeiana]|uniref:Uncharacterized protein n=1 Tax=Aquarana catesbeiana TaxID=8400 RepID=A0A2G9RIH1_AQUCT|nr:hypothetical protein AB205_0064230 [Aquarana catesbeiana]
MTYMSPGCGTSSDCIFCQTRWNPGHHYLHFFSTLPSTSAEAPEVQPVPSTQEEDVEEPSLAQESLSQEVAVASSLMESQVPPLCPPTKRTRKVRNLEESATAVLRQATTALNITSGVHETFGCVRASKLEHMEEGQCTICEEIILKVLNKGTRGELTNKTHLCELDTTNTTATQPTRAAWKEAWKEVLRVMAWVWCGLAKDAGCCKTTASGHICHLLLLPISQSPRPYCAPY